MFMHVYVCVHTYGDNLWELALYFYHVGPCDQVFRLGSIFIHQDISLALAFSFLKNKYFIAKVRSIF